MRLPPLVALGALLLVGCGSPSEAESPASTQAPITGARDFAPKPFNVVPVARFDAPWAMAFLPDGRLLVTEKAGRIMLDSLDGKHRRAVADIAGVDHAGQGGLMDIVLDPGFARNGQIYFSYSHAGPGGKGVVLARATLSGARGAERLTDIETLFSALPLVDGNGHYSGRIAFSPDGRYLFFTNGERQKFDPAQDPKSTLGKVLRLNLDGTPAADNPLAARGFNPAIWSYGHRNLLGIAFDAKGRLWELEMGPKGGDELNLILPGRNYGWPIVSNGDHYDGRPIPDHPTRPDFEAPKVSWNPVISPSSLMIYSGAMFPAWQGSAFIGGLSSQSLVRVAFDGDKAREAERFDMGARIRAVRQGPDGALWLLEDGESGGRLLKLTPRG